MVFLRPRGGIDDTAGVQSSMRPRGARRNCPLRAAGLNSFSQSGFLRAIRSYASRPARLLSRLIALLGWLSRSGEQSAAGHPERALKILQSGHPKARRRETTEGLRSSLDESSVAVRIASGERPGGRLTGALGRSCRRPRKDLSRPVRRPRAAQSSPLIRGGNWHVLKSAPPRCRHPQRTRRQASP